mmetsp:Transcript_3314/g.5078  ORF Transcript_3314/g.5078 Transcript_3314/m.5078 type:complete len:202 (+) Transcript_3314:1788-2393(+)
MNIGSAVFMRLAHVLSSLQNSFSSSVLASTAATPSVTGRVDDSLLRVYMDIPSAKVGETEPACLISAKNFSNFSLSSFPRLASEATWLGPVDLTSTFFASGEFAPSFLPLEPSSDSTGILRQRSSRSKAIGFLLPLYIRSSYVVFEKSIPLALSPIFDPSSVVISMAPLSPSQRTSLPLRWSRAVRVSSIDLAVPTTVNPS